jgi:hypothetical protein
MNGILRDFALLLPLLLIPSPTFGHGDPGRGGEAPDFTAGGTIPEGSTHDWNLGPTGLRGWMHSHRMETTDARQVLITEVADGSPAAGILAKGDVILGIGRREFAGDPRVELGRAIGEAEAKSGKLRLLVWREGRKKRVTIPLAKLGAYSDTAPFDCRKSERIYEACCDALARRMLEKPEDGHPITRCWNALALLASGEKKYLPVILPQVEWAAGFTDPERRSLHSWQYGPANLLLAEYILVTGDRTHFSALERVTREILAGQSVIGSWGHRFVQTNGRLAGYGMMNAPGLPLVISLVLAREAGVEDPRLDEAIAKTARLVRYYVGKGAVPYGDHHPWIETHEDNGKNGAAAVLFHLLGDVEAASYFARMSVASHGAERDTGHTGNFFNMLWAMPGVALAGPVASGAWMEEFGWYYDLARGWDGKFTHQGPPQPKPDSYRNWDASGTLLVAYAQSRGVLSMTGRKASIVPALDRETAESTVADGRGWGPARKHESYTRRSDAEVIAGLRSWSPVVRERSALEWARRTKESKEPRYAEPTVPLIPLLGAEASDARLGACQAIIHLRGRGAPAVEAVRANLRATDPWLRIQAANALAAIGGPARGALPELLSMLAEPPTEGDPRGMQQRYLCFALFDRRDGMLRGDLAEVDRALLLEAVRAGLANEDGRARGTLGSVYEKLSLGELAPLLPAILEAVEEPAPSGIMFADGIRLSGLELLARHRIAEGLPLAVPLIDPDRWGMDNRIRRCLKVLETYGGAARDQIPALRELKGKLAAKRWSKEKIDALKIDALIEKIEADRVPLPLRPLSGVGS